MARTWRPATASRVRSLQLSTIFAAVTLSLSKNRHAPSQPARVSSKRRWQTVLDVSICSRITPPFYPGAHPRRSHVSRGSRFLSFLLPPASESYQAASGKRFLPLDPSKELIPTAQTTDLFAWAFGPSFLTI